GGRRGVALQGVALVEVLHALAQRRIERGGLVFAQQLAEDRGALARGRRVPPGGVERGHHHDEARVGRDLDAVVFEVGADRLRGTPWLRGLLPARLGFGLLLRGLGRLLPRGGALRAQQRGEGQGQKLLHHGPSKNKSGVRSRGARKGHFSRLALTTDSGL